MNRLLKIEWLKIIHYRTAWIFIALYFLLLILMGIFIPQLKPNLNGNEVDIARLGAYNFPVVWHNITYFAAIGKLFLAVIIVTNITNEYSNRTLKQNLIDGLSKKEFLTSKLITVSILVLLSTLLVFLIVLYLGLIYGDTSAASIWSGAGYILAYMLKLFFFFSLVMFFSFLSQKSAFAILMLFVWWVVEGILTGIETFIRTMQPGLQMDDVTLITTFLPLNSSSALIPFPQINLENFMQGLPIFVEQQISWAPVVSTLLYTVLFIYLSYLLLLKRNL